jgi:hypothetical protein
LRLPVGRSGARYDLTDDAITIEVTSVLAGDGQTIFNAVDASGAYVQMLSEISMLIPRRVPAAGGYIDLPGVPYDPVAHRFWRLRQEGTTTHWEASPDGTNWSEIGSIEGFLDPSAVRIDFGAGTWTPTATPGLARFARLGPPAGR